MRQYFVLTLLQLLATLCCIRAEPIATTATPLDLQSRLAPPARIVARERRPARHKHHCAPPYVWMLRMCTQRNEREWVDICFFPSSSVVRSALFELRAVAAVFSGDAATYSASAASTDAAAAAGGSADRNAGTALPGGDGPNEVDPKELGHFWSDTDSDSDSDDDWDHREYHGYERGWGIPWRRHRPRVHKRPRPSGTHDGEASTSASAPAPTAAAMTKAASSAGAVDADANAEPEKDKSNADTAPEASHADLNRLRDYQYHFHDCAEDFVCEPTLRLFADDDSDDESPAVAGGAASAEGASGEAGAGKAGQTDDGRKRSGSDGGDDGDDGASDSTYRSASDGSDDDDAYGWIQCRPRNLDDLMMQPAPARARRADRAGVPGDRVGVPGDRVGVQDNPVEAQEALAELRAQLTRLYAVLDEMQVLLPALAEPGVAGAAAAGAADATAGGAIANMPGARRWIDPLAWVDTLFRRIVGQGIEGGPRGWMSWDTVEVFVWNYLYHFFDALVDSERVISGGPWP